MATGKACLEVEENMLFLNESLHRFNDRLCEPSIEREQVIELSALTFSSRIRESNPVEKLDERFLCVVEESSIYPPGIEPSTAPLDQPAFEHDSSKDTIVITLESLPFCRTSRSLH